MKDYIEKAIRTESSNAPHHIRTSMSLAGLIEQLMEVGEVADLFKKSTFYDGNLERLSEAQQLDLIQKADASGVCYKGEVNGRLLHAGLGILTEAVEFLEALHKAAIKGVPIDGTNLREELGDTLWYQAIAMDELETTFEAEQKRNIDKLVERYPHKFTQECANNRDLEAERQVLERD